MALGVRLQFPPGWLPKSTGVLTWQHSTFPFRWGTWVRCLLVEAPWNCSVPGTHPLQVTCQKLEQLKYRKQQVCRVAIITHWLFRSSFVLECYHHLGTSTPSHVESDPKGELEDWAKEQGVLPVELDVYRAFKSVDELNNWLKNWFALNQINLKLSILVNDSLSFNVRVLRSKNLTFST